MSNDALPTFKKWKSLDFAFWLYDEEWIGEGYYRLTARVEGEIKCRYEHFTRWTKRNVREYVLPREVGEEIGRILNAYDLSSFDGRVVKTEGISPEYGYVFDLEWEDGSGVYAVNNEEVDLPLDMIAELLHQFEWHYSAPTAPHEPTRYPHRKAPAIQDAMTIDEEAADYPGGWLCECGTIVNGEVCPSCGRRVPQGEPNYTCICGLRFFHSLPAFCPDCGDLIDQQ